MSFRKYQKNRYIGTESEVGLISLSGLEAGKAAESIMPKYPSQNRNGFIANGGRTYVDGSSGRDYMGRMSHCHLEYATPECSTPWEAAMYHHAARYALMPFLKGSPKETASNVRVYLDNADLHNTTYGTHENYQVQRHLFTNRTCRDGLVAFLSSSVILFGSGFSNSHGKYLLSVRGMAVDCEMSECTTERKAILNLRDETLMSNDRKFARLHITCRDNTMSERATYMKLATTSLVLTALEAGICLDDLRPLDSVEAMRRFSSDLRLVSQVATRLGNLTALQIQATILARVTDFFQLLPATHVPDWAPECLSSWKEALEYLENLDLFTEPKESEWIEWVVKYRHLERYCELYPTATAEEMFAVCLEYHALIPVESLAYDLVGSGYLQKLFSEDQLRTAACKPSSCRRAAIRAAWAQKANTMPKGQYIGWEGIWIERGEKDWRLRSFPFPIMK